MQEIHFLFQLILLLSKMMNEYHELDLIHNIYKQLLKQQQQLPIYLKEDLKKT